MSTCNISASFTVVAQDSADYDTLLNRVTANTSFTNVNGNSSTLTITFDYSDPTSPV